MDLYEVTANESLSDNGSVWSEMDTRWCYVVGRAAVCVRISIMVSLGLVTGAFCLARVIQYHCSKAKNYHQYLVYYIAILICILSVIHWGYVRSPIFDLILTYLIILQMLVISWFFCSWAFRILQKEKFFKCFILPFILGGVLVYFTSCLIWASLRMRDISLECAEPQWLLFTSSQLVLIQCFLLCVIYITRRLDHVRTMRTNRFSQKAQLWGLTVMYEVVSLTSFAYDLTVMVTRSVDHQCGTKFSGESYGVAIIYVLHKLIKYFVPQLTICVVFAPLKSRAPSMQQEIEETDTLSWADKPDYKSTFYSDSNTTIQNNREDSVLSYPVNPAEPILPRRASQSSSCQNNPWIKPGQSWNESPYTHS